MITVEFIWRKINGRKIMWKMPEWLLALPFLIHTRSPDLYPNRDLMLEALIQVPYLQKIWPALTMKGRQDYSSKKRICTGQRSLSQLRK